MDAIVWARVDRKTRLPELAQHFELLDDAHPKQCAPQPDVDDDMSATMETPGLLRKVCFRFNDLATAFRYAQELGQRCTDFAHGLGEFFTVQQLTLSQKPLQSTSPTAKQFWAARAQAVADLRSACEGLRLACQDPLFVGECVLEQIRVVEQSGQAGWEEMQSRTTIAMSA